MGLTVAQLIACGIAPTQAKTFADPLSAACALYGIDTPERLAAFLAQAMHESAGFTSLEENLFYRSPERIRANFPSRVPDLATAAGLTGNPRELALKVYAGRLGNGDRASGDGWTFRGRGLFQLTGRANYRRAGQHAGHPYEEQPELVATPTHAALTAAWYWTEEGCNALDLAKAGSFDLTTRRINGAAMLHAKERREAFAVCLRVLRGK